MRHALALAGLVLVLTAASPALAQYEERYFPVGRFAVMVPQDTEDYATQVVQDQGQAVVRHEYVLGNESGDFKVMVSYMDKSRELEPAARESFFREVFTATAQTPMDAGTATLLSQSMTERLGFPAMELSLDISLPSGQVRLMVLAVAAGSRLYVLKASAPDPDLCARVMESFWIAPH